MTTRQCSTVSLKGHRCILESGHAFGHERFDGRTWPHGQTWADVVEMFFRREGLL